MNKQEKQEETKYTDWINWEKKPLEHRSGTEMMRVRYFVKDNELVQEVEAKHIK